MISLVYLNNLPPAEVITTKTMTEIFPSIRTVIATLLNYVDEWDANNVIDEIQAAEALVDVGNDEIAVYGTYDTNDIRRWSLALGALLTAFNANVTVTLADATTETRTAKSIFQAYYAPYVAPAP